MTMELEDRESCVILRAVTADEPDSDPSVAMWSAPSNSDVLAAAIDKPVEVVGADGCGAPGGWRRELTDAEETARRRVTSATSGRLVLW